MEGTDMRKALRPALLCVTAALALAVAPATAGSPTQRAAPVDHPERIAARVDVRPVAPGTYLTLRDGRRVKVDAQVTYRDAAGAVLATNHLGGERVFTNCTNLSGYGSFCFRRTHAIEFRLFGGDTYEWRGWAKLECLLNNAPTNCNYRHLDFTVYGHLAGGGNVNIASKDFPDELGKPVALYGGTFRPDYWISNQEYWQQTAGIDRPSTGYYARHVASGYRTVWRYGCSHQVQFIGDPEAHPMWAECLH
jgi:hypothetical protein